MTGRINDCINSVVYVYILPLIAYIRKNLVFSLVLIIRSHKFEVFIVEITFVYMFTRNASVPHTSWYGNILTLELNFEETLKIALNEPH